MNITQFVQNIIREALEQSKDFIQYDSLDIQLTMPAPKIDAHYSSNVIFALRPNAKQGFEEAITAAICGSEYVDEAQITGGYLNLKMSAHFFEKTLTDLQ